MVTGFAFPRWQVQQFTSPKAGIGALLISRTITNIRSVRSNAGFEDSFHFSGS